MKNQTYTIELFKPAYPCKGVGVAIHKGEFSLVRDFLSPCMVQANEFVGDIRGAREMSRILKTTYLSR